MADTNEPLSTRDVIAAAYDKYEDAGEDAPLQHLEETDVSSEAPDEPTDAAEADRAALGGDPDRAREAPEDEEAAQRARDDKTGRFTKAEKAAAAKPPVIRKGGPVDPATPQEQTGAVPPPAPAAPASDRTTRAPQSWRPGAREGFEKLPPTARAEVWRLEGEREKLVRETAPLRRFDEQWRQTIGPYEQAIRASGVEPLQAVGNVMRTVHALGTQPEPVRARIIHQMMKLYGVRTETLADAIDEAGGPPGQGTGAAPAQPQPVYDPRFDAFYQQYQQRQQAEEQQRSLAVDNELDEFARTHDFADDVLPEMYDFMAVAAQRGLEMDFETAYTRSIALRPDLAEILQQREAAAASPNGPTQRALRASSSVRASPARRPDGQKTRFEDTRAAAAAAYDAHAGDGGRV